MGLFLRSGACLLAGMVFMLFAWIISLVPFLPMMFMMIIGILLWLVGMVFLIYSLLAVYVRAKETTLYYPLEDHQPGKLLWAYCYKDYELIFTPAVRELEYYSYSEKLNQQIKDFKSYRLGNWPLRIVPECAGTSADLKICLYLDFAKKEWGARNIRDLRKLFKKEHPLIEQATTIKEYEEMKSHAESKNKEA